MYAKRKKLQKLKYTNLKLSGIFFWNIWIWNSKSKCIKSLRFFKGSTLVPPQEKGFLFYYSVLLKLMYFFIIFLFNFVSEMTWHKLENSDDDVIRSEFKSRNTLSRIGI